MNKLVITVVGAVVVVGAATAIVVARGDDEPKSPATTKTQKTNVATGKKALVAVDACDVLTSSAAKKVLGDQAEKGDTSAGNASTDDISVSNCVYTFKGLTTGPIKEQLASIKTAGVLARAAKTDAGAASNKTPFTTAKPAGVQDISGYGDKAYFNPATGQLNILAGNNWYIISNYTGTSPTAATLDQVKVLADAIKANLK